MNKFLVILFSLVALITFNTPAVALDSAVEAVIGGHIYGSNDFLDKFDPNNFRKEDFTAPSSMCAIPVGEMSFIINLPTIFGDDMAIPQFSLGITGGTYIGGDDAYDPAFHATAQTVYGLITPRLKWDLEFIRPVIGFAIGSTWYNFSYFEKANDSIIPPVDNHHFDSFTFAYGPSFNVEVPIISSIYALVGYKYLFTVVKDQYDSGGHVFTMGIGASFDAVK